MMEDITLPTFRTRAEQIGVWRSVKMTPRPTVKIAKNITVRFRSADEPDKMRGPNLSGIWLDEASLMPEDAYKVAIGSLRESEQGWLSCTMTPKGLSHWTYKTFGQSQEDTEAFFAPTRLNPFLPPGFAETLAKQYQGLWAAQELEGRFVAMEGAEWPGVYFDDVWFSEWPKDLVHKAQALDPSKGRGDKVEKDGRPADDSAYVWGGLTKDGILWVDADMDNRRDTSRIVQDGIRIHNEFGPQGFVVEVNQFQAMFLPEFKRIADHDGFHMPLFGINNTLPKVERIRTLTTYLSQRKIRFKSGSPGAERLVAQLRDFPVGTHDDGPDALEMLIRMLWWLVGRRDQRDGPVAMRA
jgi:predicted phage terminase large subunit-like protein